MRIITHILINALAIALAVKIVPGIDFVGGDILTYIIAGLALGIINSFIKPILKIISIPLLIVTLGLFSIVINIIGLWLLAYIIEELTITGFWAYIWGTLVISLVNVFVGMAIKKDS